MPKLLTDTLPYIFIGAAALFLLSGIFAPGPMSGYDNSIHYYEAYYLAEKLIPVYHWINGWSLQGMAGCPILLHHPQIGFFLIAFLNKLFLIPLGLSYKLVVLLSYILLGGSFYKLSSYRFGQTASLFVSVIFMLQKDIYYDKLLPGLWNNFLGISLLLIFLHTLDKYSDTFNRRKTILVLGLILGLLILTHLFAAIFALVVFALYAIFYMFKTIKGKSFTKKLAACISIPLIAGIISAYYLYDFFISRGYFSTLPGKDIYTGFIWSLKSLFGPLYYTKKIIPDLMINFPVISRVLFSLLGLYVFLKKEENSRRKYFLRLTLYFIIISILLFSDILSRLFTPWKSIPLLGSLQTNRFLIYTHIGLYIFTAYGFSWLLKNSVKKKTAIIILSFVLMASSLIFNYKYLARDASKTLHESKEMADIFKVWDWVDRNVPPNRMRIGYQNTIGNSEDPILARSDVFALSGVFTDVPQIGVFLSATAFPQERFMRNENGNIFGKNIKIADDKYIEEMMYNFNSGYIVSVEPQLRDKLRQSNLFKEEKDFGSLNIFGLRNFKASWIEFEKSAEYKTRILKDQELAFDIQNNSENNKAVIKISFHPLWKAALNGNATGICKGKYGLMEISLPEKGLHKLNLLFNSFNPVTAVVSLISIITVCSIIIWERR